MAVGTLNYPGLNANVSVVGRFSGGKSATVYLTDSLMDDAVSSVFIKI